MKGKSTFTQEEANAIEQLILQKLQATADKQKGIRDKIRKLGFYANDFSVKKAYDIADFRNSVRIIGTKKSSAAIPKKEVVKSITTKQNAVLTSDAISTNFTAKELESLGFVGFKSIVSIRKSNYQDLPKEKGVYMILLNDRTSIAFLKEGTGGYFKQKNPNVSIEILEDNWVEKTNVLYIGKAGSESGSATLVSRLKQYFRFGNKEAVGHWGGRYIWQLADAEELLVCWKATPNKDPRYVEKELIAEFVKQFNKRPFANLVG